MLKSTEKEVFLSKIHTLFTFFCYILFVLKHSGTLFHTLVNN